METIIKEARTLIGSLGTYARLVVVGVWFPGFLIFCELGFAYFLFFCPSDNDLFGHIAEKINEYDSSVITTFIVVFVVFLFMVFVP